MVHLFLVGDPKQSIYRFRRGDIVTYNRVKDDLSSSREAKCCRWSKSFRSAEMKSVTWNNCNLQLRSFLPEANQYIAAAENMVQGRVDVSEAMELSLEYAQASPAELNAKLGDSNRMRKPIRSRDSFAMRSILK